MYEKHEWIGGETGTPATPERMNHIEEGIYENSQAINGDTSMGSIVVEDISCKNIFEETKNLKIFTAARQNIVYGNFNIVAGQTYAISFDTNNNGGYVYVNETLFSYQRIICDGTRKTLILNALVTGNYTNEIFIKTNTATTTAYDISNVMLEKGSESTLPYVPYKEFSNKQHYSTSEQVIGTWIDGKTLYRKVVNFGALPNATTTTVAHGISNLGVVTDIKGIATNSATGKRFPLPYSSTTLVDNNIDFSCNNTDITITTGVDRTGLDICYVILEYTKTDTSSVSTTSLEDEEES